MRLKKRRKKKKQNKTLTNPRGRLLKVTAEELF